MFEWITVVSTALIAYLVAAILGYKLVPFLRKVKYGQTIKKIGPSWHKNKQGTPTMGGIMFIIGSTIAFGCAILIYVIAGRTNEFFNSTKSTVGVIAGFVMALLFGLVGFLDDYIKVVKKQNLGLNAKQKLIFQFLIAGAYLFTLSRCGYSGGTYIPFVGYVQMGIIFWIVAAVAIVGIVNAVNLTDGIDGLNGTVTFVASTFCFMIASLIKFTGMEYYSAAIAGGCLGFLMWNMYPAKTFMGDTGSLFLGGAVCAMLFGMDLPILIFLIGIIYIAEELSVVLQVTYFKLTKGKRLFKMSPLHHHFEMCKWSERKIVAVFSLTAFIGGIISYLLILWSTVYLGSK